MFTALFLDAFAISGQSLIGFFVGADDTPTARRVAVYVCAWSLLTGTALGAFMLVTTGLVAEVLVPPSARPLFHSAWWLAAVAQPLNALSFGTDGIHWGTGDFRFLRNAVVVATIVGLSLLLLVDTGSDHALFWIWLITGVWITVRAGFGVTRIWPGFGSTPLAKA
jgi:MATE family multidrug resistance protein